MSRSNWSRGEVEAIVDDYLSMLTSQLNHMSYNKTAHRKTLISLLAGRSPQAIEYKHANISAVLVDASFPSINGYKPRFNYQALLRDVVHERIVASSPLRDLAARDVELPVIAVPEVDDILSILVKRAPSKMKARAVRESASRIIKCLPTNYVEREAHNRSLGLAGEKLILEYEDARLTRAGKKSLAAKIEHTSQVRGDHEGFDIMSFELNGAERLIEVKTTNYAGESPFFVTRNELSVSRNHSAHYFVYRLFSFRDDPKLFTLPGAIDASCLLTEATYLARPR